VSASGRVSGADASSPAGRRPRAGEARVTVEAAFPAAPLEPRARLLTGLAGLLAVAAAVVLALVSDRGLLLVLGAPSLFLVILAVPLALSPAGYAVGGRELVVLRRGVRPLVFPLGSLAAARPTAMPRSVRLPGSGGLFGWWGSFANRDWGRFKAYATDRRRGVLLEWPGFKLFISPEDPERLCQAVVERRRGRSKGGPA
jgi:PH (Pleckstrin Homology) domain-containing protein